MNLISKLLILSIVALYSVSLSAQIKFYNNLPPIKTSKAIVVGNNVNILEFPSFNSKIIGQCNFGDEITIFDIPSYEYPITETKYPLGDQKILFNKVNIKGEIGWINCQYLSTNYVYNKIEKYYVYTITLIIDGLDNLYSLNVYNTETKQKISKELTAYHIILSQNAKYAASYIGERIDKLEIYKMPSLEIVFKDGDLQVISVTSFENNAFFFKKVVSRTKVNHSNKIKFEKVIFKDGIVQKTGEFSNEVFYNE